MSDKTLGTHPGDIYIGRFSVDGRWLATAGKEAIVRLYDVATGDLKLELPTGQGEVNSVAFAPDGKQLATAGDDGTVRIWDIETPREVVRIEAHDGLTFQVVFTSDGRLISCGAEPTIRIWDTMTGKPRGVLNGHNRSVEAITLAPDGRHLGSCARDQTAILWDLQTGKKARLLTRGKRTVACLAFSTNGAFAATGTIGGLVHVHDMARRKNVAWFRHLDSIRGIALSPNGRFVAVADRGGTINVWQIPMNTDDTSPLELTEPIAAWAAHSGSAWSIDFSPDGRSLCSTGSDGKVKLWQLQGTLGWHDLDLSRDSTRRRSPKERRWLAALTPTPTLVTAVHPHGLLLWDLANTTSALSAATSSDLQSTITPSAQAPDPVVLDQGDWTVVDVSADGRWLAAGSTQGEVAIWDSVSRKQRWIWSLERGQAVHSLVFSPTATMLAAHTDGRVWLVETGKPDEIRSTEMVTCRAVAFCPKGARLAVSRGNEVMLTATPSLDVLSVFRGHTRSVVAIAWSSDGRWVASGSDDRTIILWDAIAKRPKIRLRGHRGGITGLAFSPDNRSLAAVDDTGVLKLWHLASGQELCVLDQVPERYCCVDFLPGGAGLVCGYGKHHVRFLQWSMAE